MKTVSAIIITALFGLGACSNPSPQYYGAAALNSATPQASVTKTIQILSEPPGARIEVNYDYIGNAPCSVEIRCNTRGRFLENTVIRALPVEEGYTQTKAFIGYDTSIMNRQADPIPARIFFQMNLGPVTPEVDVNVNQ
jgi:hypothetical protein